MDLFESVNKLLQDKHTLTEAKTVLRVTFDNGMKKDIEFKGSFEDGKKAYLGKNVKAMSKDKTPVMLKAVKVEPINESKDDSKRITVSYEIWDEDSIEAGETDDKGWEDEEGEEFDSVEDAIKFLKKNFANNPSNGSYHSGTYYKDDGKENYKTGETKYLTYHLSGNWSEEEKKAIYKAITNKRMKESKELEPIKTFKVTFHDGSSYKTSVRSKSAEDFKKYLTQDGPWVVTDEDEETGKETKKKIVKVEMLDEGDKSNELKDGDLVFYNDGRDWLKGKLISDEQISATGNKFWYVDSFANRRTRKDIKTPEEMREFRNKKLTGVKQI